MNLRRIWCLLLLCALAASAHPQASSSNPDVKTDTAALVRDVTDLLAKHFPTKEQLRAGADRVAKTYRAELKSVPKQVRHLIAEADSKLKAMAWQEKLNLALELWRVRSSLDLMMLVSPEVLEEVTGMKIPDLRHLIADFAHFETRIRAIFPF